MNHFYYERGMQLLTQGNLGQALDTLLKLENHIIEYSDALYGCALILMYKGEFNDSFKLFHLNSVFNEHKLSKIYVEQVDEINSLIEKYNFACTLIKQEKFSQAFVAMQRLMDRGFRTVHSEALLALLHLYKNQHASFIDILTRLKQNFQDWELLKELETIEYEIKVLERDNKARRRLGLAALLAVTSSVGIYGTIKKPKEVIRAVTKKEYVEKEVKVEVPVFKEKETNTEEDSYRAILSDATDYLYNLGIKYYNSGRYEKSALYFETAYKFRRGNYLDQHCLYYYGKSLQKLHNDTWVSLMEEYISEYPSGCYIEEILYLTSLKYAEKGNMEKAKRYAAALALGYKNSIYNNDNVKQIFLK